MYTLKLFYLKMDQEMHFTLSSSSFLSSVPTSCWNSLKSWWKIWIFNRHLAVHFFIRMRVESLPLTSVSGWGGRNSSVTIGESVFLWAGTSEAAAVGRGAQAQWDLTENRCPGVRAVVPGRPAPFCFWQPQGWWLLFWSHWKRFVEVFIRLTLLKSNSSNLSHALLYFELESFSEAN